MDVSSAFININWLSWVTTFTGIQYLFEMKSLQIFMVNAGYSLISLSIMGTILGAW